MWVSIGYNESTFGTLKKPKALFGNVFVILSVSFPPGFSAPVESDSLLTTEPGLVSTNFFFFLIGALALQPMLCWYVCMFVCIYADEHALIKKSIDRRVT